MPKKTARGRSTFLRYALQYAKKYDCPGIFATLVLLLKEDAQSPDVWPNETFVTAALLDLSDVGRLG
jgi:hypothetical protein